MSFKMNHDLFFKLPETIQEEILDEFIDNARWIRQRNLKKEDFLKQMKEEPEVAGFLVEKITTPIHGDLIHIKWGSVYWDTFTMQQVGKEWLEAASLN